MFGFISDWRIAFAMVPHHRRTAKKFRVGEITVPETALALVHGSCSSPHPLTVNVHIDDEALKWLLPFMGCPPPSSSE